MSLYHKLVGFPEHMVIPHGEFIYPEWTNHAIESWREDVRRKPTDIPPHRFRADIDTLIEAEFEDHCLVKMVFRLDYDKWRDLVLVIRNPNKLITVWFVNKEDQHANLDLGRYDTP